jgi:hypothetical protein
MNRKQTNKLTMFKTVDQYLADHNSVWSLMAPFMAAVTQFRTMIEAIDTAAQKQETPLTGSAEDKVAARDDLEDVLFLTCEALGVLAHTGGDHELGALVNVTRSSLDKLDDEELANRATNVQARADANKTQLVAMHVTQANLDELAQALQNFQTAKAKPRSAVVERSVQTGSVSSLMRETGNILRDQIDRLVNLFGRSNPEFVAGYRSARVIVDRTGRRPAPGATPPAPMPPQS